MRVISCVANKQHSLPKLGSLVEIDIFDDHTPFMRAKLHIKYGWPQSLESEFQLIADFYGLWL